MPKRKAAFVVEIELPRQLIEIHAYDEDDATFKAWNMIGLAGVRNFGHVVATRLAPVGGRANGNGIGNQVGNDGRSGLPASPTVTRTRPPA